MGANYYNELNNSNIIKLREFLKELPPFCSEFIMGIQNNSSVLTRKAYAYDFKIFFNFLTTEISIFCNKKPHELTLDDMEKITLTHIEQYLNYLSYYSLNDRYYTNRENAKSRKIASVKSLFKYFFNKDKLTKNVMSKVSMPKLHDKPIIKLETDEVVRLLNFADNVSADNSSPESKRASERQLKHMERLKIRDSAILTLFLGTGIRVSELVGLNIDDFDFEVNGFSVTRKGGNKVILYFSDEVAETMINYIKHRSRLLDVPHEERALFLSSQKRRLCARAVENLVKKYAKMVVPLKKITPHKLRSTYGTSLYRETQDIYVVADVLGHKDVNTTKKHYAAISDDIRRNAANKVKLRDDD